VFYVLFVATTGDENKITRQLKITCRHVMPSLLHVCSGLARPADKSMLAQDITVMFNIFVT